MFECYDNIIGFTQADCQCNQSDRPADYNVSKSGLYLDEISPITGLVALAECDRSMWDILIAARAGAVKQFVADSNGLLAKKYRLKRKIASKQVLGQVKAKDTVQPLKNYAVVRVCCSPIRGGVMRLQNIGGVFSNTGAVQVDVYNNIDGYLHSYNISTVVNKHSSTPVGVEYPLYSKYVQPLEYYFVYQFDPANLPKETEVNCGCGNWIPNFDVNTPYYNNVGSHKAAGWADYVMVGGAQINSLTELEDMPSTMQNDMYGLTLEFDFSCKVNEVLCEDALDFTGNPLALSMALAIQYATAVRVANGVIKSTLLTRENMVGRDEWEESALVWQAKYNEHINYIVNQADFTANDCLTCKDMLGMTRQGLFA